VDLTAGASPERPFRHGGRRHAVEEIHAVRALDCQAVKNNVSAKELKCVLMTLRFFFFFEN
jgi:hypothetical protein